MDFIKKNKGLLSFLVVLLFFFMGSHVLIKGITGNASDESETVKRKPTEEMKKDFYSGELSVVQMQNELDNYLGTTPDFTKTLEVVDDSPKKVITKTIEMVDIITAYLDGLFIQQNKLNNVATNLKDELMMIEEKTSSDVRDEVVTVEGAQNPLATALMEEMNQTPLYIHSDNNNYSVWVDYDVIEREYSQYLSRFHKDLIKLHKDVIRFGYRNSNGEINTSALFNRLMLIDEIQDGNKNKDDYYWENERYQLAVLYTGYGQNELPTWSKERVSKMEEILSSHGVELSEDEDTMTTNTYLNITMSLVQSIKEEGGYKEETMRLANEWMHREFYDYKLHLENIKKDEKVNKKDTKTEPEGGN